MSETLGALVSAKRALQAELSLRDKMQPLLDVVGEALEFEKLLDEQRTEKVRLEAEIKGLMAKATNADSDIAKLKQDAEAKAAAKLEYAKQVRDEAERELKLAQRRADAMVVDAQSNLADANNRAAKIIADAEAKASAMEAGKTSTLTALDAQIASRQALLKTRDEEIKAANGKLADITAEFNRFKAKFG